MNESLYKLYQSMRELIISADEFPLSDDSLRQFSRESRINIERYDRANPDCLKRWLKEKQQGIIK